jgi:hypothetical protein
MATLLGVLPLVACCPWVCKLKTFVPRFTQVMLCNLTCLPVGVALLPRLPLPRPYRMAPISIGSPPPPFEALGVPAMEWLRTPWPPLLCHWRVKATTSKSPSHLRAASKAVWYVSGFVIMNCFTISGLRSPDTNCQINVAGCVSLSS